VAMQEELFDSVGEAEKASGSEDVPARLPYIVIVVDEVADIMAAVG